MYWQCRLYGHQWRHPRQHEVILRGDNHRLFPFECTLCGAEMHLDSNGSQQFDVTLPQPGRSELASELEQEISTEVDTGTETEQP